MRRLRPSFRYGLRILCFGLVVAAALVGARTAGLLRPLELKAYDALLARTGAGDRPEGRIVRIGLTEQDIVRLGHWPITDDELATILETILADGPAVVGLDLYRDLPVPPGGERLRALFAARGKDIVVVTKMGGADTADVAKPWVATPDSPIGFSDILVDPDGLVRRGLLFLDDGHTALPSLALVLAMRQGARQGLQAGADRDDPRLFRFGATTIAPLETPAGGYAGIDARGYQFLLDFPAKGAGIERHGVGELLDGKLAPGSLRGRTVVLGTEAESVNDIFHLPVPWAATDSSRVSGIALHAVTASQLLRLAEGTVRPIGTPGPWSAAGGILALALAGGALGTWARSLPRLGLLAAGGGLAVTAGAGLALGRGVWLPLVPLLAAWLSGAALAVAAKAFRERTRRLALMRLFAAHVSPAAASHILEHQAQILDNGRLKPQSLTATVLFTDIQGFTTVAESMTPEALMDWLNAYMETMNQVIFRHDGLINKYIGDAILVVFGVPLPRSRQAHIREDAQRAVRCALDMGQALETFNAGLAATGAPPIRMRVGIATGPLVAGCLGDARRLEYTVIGDTVNVASRLESYDKAYGADSVCRVLVGETTRCHLGGMFVTRCIGAVRLKGKTRDIAVHHVLSADPSGEIAPEPSAASPTAPKEET